MKIILIKLFVGVVLFATLVAMRVLGIEDADIKSLCMGGLLGLGIMHLGAPSAAAAPKNGGYASPWLLLALAVVCIMLTGCAGMSQAVQAYGSVAVTNARAANDTLIEAQKVAFCGLPLSAITRHPEIIPAVRALCLDGGDKNGAALLDEIAK